MIKLCDKIHLTQCIEIAFKKNSVPETNCAYCPNTELGIKEDIQHLMDDSNSCVIGLFDNDRLLGFLGCFHNPNNHWVDCIGPFFNINWNESYAKEMLTFAQNFLVTAKRFNFYYNIQNKDVHQLMLKLNAIQNDNEYILVLNENDYVAQQINQNIIEYDDLFKDELIALHDNTFKDVYITGNEIIEAKNRKVFCALDGNNNFVGYGVLKFDMNYHHFTAEIFAVKENKRKKGYGWALLNKVVASAINEFNAKTIDLVVDKFNSNAKELYYLCGFKLKVENESFYVEI